MDLRWHSFNHASFGDHPKLVRGCGIKDENVGAAGGAGFRLDGAEFVRVASVFGVVTFLALEFWSLHLDVKAFVEAHAICFSFVQTSGLIVVNISLLFSYKMLDDGD